MTGDVVGIGIVGTGRWAEAHAEAAARSDNVSIVCCFGPSPDRREAFAVNFGADSVASLDQLIVNEAVEAIIVSTPNDTHVEIATAALAAGKPVLVDKPVAADVAQGLRLLRRVDADGPACAVGHHARRLAGHRAARRWLDSHPAGKARVAHASFANNRGVGLGADSWKRRGPGAEGGVLTQVGIHQVDNLIYLLGPVRSINARFSYGDVGTGIAESAALVMAHAAGALSTVTTSWTTPGHYRLDLLTTGANLSFRLDYEGWWRDPAVDEHGELVLKEPGAEPAVVSVAGGDPLVEQLEELGRTARYRTPIEIGVVDGIRTVAVVHGAIASAERGGAEVDLGDVLREAGATADEIDLVIGRSD